MTCWKSLYLQITITESDLFQICVPLSYHVRHVKPIVTAGMLTAQDLLKVSISQMCVKLCVERDGQVGLCVSFVEAATLIRFQGLEGGLLPLF